MDLNFSIIQWVVIAFIILLVSFKTLVKIFITYFRYKANISRLHDHLEKIETIDQNFEGMTQQSKHSMNELRQKAHVSALEDEAHLKKFTQSEN